MYIKTQNDLCEITEHQLSGFWFHLDSLIKKKKKMKSVIGC